MRFCRRRARNGGLLGGVCRQGCARLRSSAWRSVTAGNQPYALNRSPCDQPSQHDPRYCDHHTPRIYTIESDVSVPIVLKSGKYFGKLCAIDPQPADVNNPKFIGIFTRFVSIIAVALNNREVRERDLASLSDERGEERASRAVHCNPRAPTCAIPCEPSAPESVSKIFEPFWRTQHPPRARARTWFAQLFANSPRTQGQPFSRVLRGRRQQIHGALAASIAPNV